MACFLTYPDSSLMMVNYSPRKGLYYQIFVDDQASRPNLLVTNGSYEYTAFLDEKINLHVIAKNDRNQIVHLQKLSNKIEKETILDDHTNEFNISDIYGLSLKNQVHLLYYANNPSTKNVELIYQLLKKPFSTPIPLGEVTNREVNFDCVKCEDKILLSMISKEDDNYIINIKSFNPSEENWISLYTPETSKFPIKYCKILMDKSGTCHLIYIQEQYGQYQLIYKNNKKGWSNNHLIYSCGYPIKPVILIYHDALWINWSENGVFKSLLSTDMGNSFSEAINNSIQDSSISIHYYENNQPDKNLICNQLYGNINYTPKFVLLHSLDMDGIHPQLKVNTELKLYLDNIKNELKISVSKSKLEEENFQLKNELEKLTSMQMNITNQYNELAELAKKIQEEGKKWRNLYKEAKSEIEFHKKRIKQLEKMLETNTKIENKNTDESNYENNNENDNDKEES
ncbi:MAG TPA: hypothetical protein PKK61_05170 [Defluviitaleaceae bacterium]|nr:hypothetical protein [Candidatus Epulonipiscium sp.]HOA80439.1 hypothetical protein [Defluviitaleaceae bacterium]